MKTYRVDFESGNYLVTGFNGTLEEAKKYYEGKTFNLGNSYKPDEDMLDTAVKVTEIK